MTLIDKSQVREIADILMGKQHYHLCGFIVIWKEGSTYFALDMERGETTYSPYRRVLFAQLRGRYEA